MTDLNFLDDGLGLLMKRPNKKQDPFYGKAKRLAKKLEIEITVEENQDYGNGYWLETDLISDERFSSSWEEVYEKLQNIQRGETDDRI